MWDARNCKVSGANSSVQMVEIVAIRALMKCRVFEHIPSSGSISLQDLSTVTGAQPSLLGPHNMLLLGLMADVA